MPNKVPDTTIVETHDSSIIVKNPMQQIILLKDLIKEPEKGLMDNPWVTSLLIPIIVAAVVAWIGYFLGKRKNNVEIEKLSVETEKIKNSFQPIVVATLQSVNDKLLDTKIKALKSLTFIRSEFIDVEQQYFEGDPIFNYDDFLEQVFRNYSYPQLVNIKKFKDEYSYFLSKKSFESFSQLFTELDALYQSLLSFHSVDDGEIDPNMNKEIISILSLFETVLREIRNELHLDNTFVEDFIKENQKIKKEDIQ